MAEVIQYFLIMEQKKFPVKRNDVMKLVPGISAKNFKTVIAQAQTYLDDVKVCFNQLGLHCLIKIFLFRCLAIYFMNLMKKVAIMFF